jgi:hypothetical protein
VGCADLVVGLYGVRRLLRDLDLRRAYHETPGSGVFGAVLDWTICEGYTEFFERWHDWKWVDAEHYRQRHVSRLLEAMIPRRRF